MPSKGVLDRQRVGQAIIAAARTHAQPVGERLQQTLSAIVADGETLSDFTTPQLELARYLERRLADLVAADEAHLEELDDDQEPRILRDEAAAVLYSTLVRIRAVINAAFGSVRGTKFLGVDGDTAQDPLTLHRQASRALARLRQPPAELPTLQVGGVTLDLSGLADELQPATDDLGRALAEVGDERRQAEETLGEKTDALIAFDTAVGGVGRTLIGYYELAGYPNFAERIRLTLPGRRSGSSDEPEAPAPDEVPRPEEAAEAPAIGFTPAASAAGEPSD